MQGSEYEGRNIQQVTVGVELRIVTLQPSASEINRARRRIVSGVSNAHGHVAEPLSMIAR